MSRSSSPMPRLSITTDDTRNYQVFLESEHQPSFEASSDKFMISNVSDIRFQSSPDPTSFSSTSAGTSGFLGTLTDISKLSPSPDQPPSSGSSRPFLESHKSKSILPSRASSRQDLLGSSHGLNASQSHSQHARISKTNHEISVKVAGKSEDVPKLYQPPALAEGLKRLAASHASLANATEGHEGLSSVTVNYRTTGSLPIPKSPGTSSFPGSSIGKPPISPSRAGSAMALDIQTHSQPHPVSQANPKSNSFVSIANEQYREPSSQRTSLSPPRTSHTRPRSASHSLVSTIHERKETAGSNSSNVSVSPGEAESRQANTPHDLHLAVERIRSLEKSLQIMQEKQDKYDAELRLINSNLRPSVRSALLQEKPSVSTLSAQDIQKLVQDTLQREIRALITSPSSQLHSLVKEESHKRVDAQFLALQVSKRLSDLELNVKRVESFVGKDIEMLKRLSQQKNAATTLSNSVTPQIQSEQSQNVKEVTNRLSSLEGQLKHLIEAIQRNDSVNMSTDLDFVSTHDDVTGDSDLSRHLETLDQLVQDVGQRAYQVLHKDQDVHQQQGPSRQEVRFSPSPVTQRSSTPRPPSRSQNTGLHPSIFSIQQRVEHVMRTLESDVRLELHHLRESQKDLQDQLTKCTWSVELVKERQKNMEDQASQLNNAATDERHGRIKRSSHYRSRSVPATTYSAVQSSSLDSSSTLARYLVQVTSPETQKNYMIHIGDVFTLFDERISAQLEEFRQSISEKVDTRVLEGLVPHIATREELKRKTNDLKKRIKDLPLGSTSSESFVFVKNDIERSLKEQLESVWQVLNPLYENSNLRDGISPSPPQRHDASTQRLNSSDQHWIQHYVSEAVQDQFVSFTQKIKADMIGLKREILQTLDDQSPTASSHGHQQKTSLTDMLNDLRSRNATKKINGTQVEALEQQLRSDLKTWLKKHFLSNYVERESLSATHEQMAQLKVELLESMTTQMEQFRKSTNRLLGHRIDSPTMTRPKSSDSDDNDLALAHFDSTAVDKLKKSVMKDVDEKLFLICSDLSAVKTLYSRQVSQPFYKCGQWLWKSGTLKMGSAVPWNYQTVNTDEDNFKWEQDSIHIRIAEAGLYEICFAFFTKSKPSIQLVVNGESVLSAIHSPSYVVHHSSGFVLDGEGRLEPGTVSGISLIDFLALPTKSTLSLHHHGVKKGSLGHGFLSLRRL